MNKVKIEVEVLLLLGLRYLPVLNLLSFIVLKLEENSGEHNICIM